MFQVFTKDAREYLYELLSSKAEELYKEVSGEPYSTGGFKSMTNIYKERIQAIPLEAIKQLFNPTESEK